MGRLNFNVSTQKKKKRLAKKNFFSQASISSPWTSSMSNTDASSVVSKPVEDSSMSGSKSFTFAWMATSFSTRALISLLCVLVWVFPSRDQICSDAANVIWGMMETTVGSASDQQSPIHQMTAISTHMTEIVQNSPNSRASRTSLGKFTIVLRPYVLLSCWAVLFDLSLG